MSRSVAESRLIPLLLAIGLSGPVTIAQAPPPRQDPESCRVVRLSDVGWTDVTATTAVVARVLTTLGYEPRVTVLSVPVTFAALRNGDIDAFLGHWLPSQREMIAPYVEDGSIDVIATNLRGARYTLAVPAYLYDAGLRDFRDISRFRENLGAKIHGIEPGNEANETLLRMIARNDAGLSGFELVESSEQAMLAAVERAVRAQEAIVFLGWSPHPMNTRLSIRYLTGGDEWFGADFGGATVHTVVRRGYAVACPNVTHLLRSVAFDVEDENGLMDAILTDRQPVGDAARAWIARHEDRVAAWTTDVVPFQTETRQNGLTDSKAVDGMAARVARHKLPVGDWATTIVDVARQHAGVAFDVLSRVVERVVGVTHTVLVRTPAALLVVLATVAAWYRRRAVGLTVFVPVALLLIMNLGYWAATVETLALVLVAAGISTAIGIPVGILAARRPRIHTLLRPLLDLMQTLPTFVYLTPALVLFGLGVVPGLLATVIFALPAPIRLTQLGLTSVPRPLLEAGQAFGATPWQLLWKIELPSASSAILTGVSQCIMLSLSMVVIAALVGAGGLGVPVVRALNTVQVGMGVEAGLAIVLLAIVLDRLARPSERSIVPATSSERQVGR